MYRAGLTDTLICVRGEYTWDKPQPPPPLFFFFSELIAVILSTFDIRRNDASGFSQPVRPECCQLLGQT